MFVVKGCESEQFILIYSGELLREKGFKCIPFRKVRSDSDIIKTFLFLSKTLMLQGA